MTSLPGLDLPALRRFLEDAGVPLAGELSATAISGGRSNLTYRISDGQSAWVLRRPPTAGLTPSAHDVGREYRVVAALAGSAVPVAPAVAHCDDPAVMGAPFAVVGFVPGQVLRTRDDLSAQTDEALAATNAELVRVLVELHAVDYAAVGLGEFGRPDGFFARQVRRWRQQWDHVAATHLPDVDRLHDALAERIPRSGDATIVHGDYRIDNTLLDADDVGRIRAVVDWELSTLGDPLTDVAMMCVYQHPDFDHVVGEPAASTSPRWPGADDIAQEYATRSGRDLSNFQAYLGLGYFKLAVIAEGIASRHRAGAGSGAGYDSAGNAVPGLLAAGLAAL